MHWLWTETSAWMVGLSNPKCGHCPGWFWADYLQIMHKAPFLCTLLVGLKLGKRFLCWQLRCPRLCCKPPSDLSPASSIYLPYLGMETGCWTFPSLTQNNYAWVFGFGHKETSAVRGVLSSSSHSFSYFSSCASLSASATLLHKEHLSHPPAERAFTQPLAKQYLCFAAHFYCPPDNECKP